MGVYIPGMEMPISCYLCPVNKDDGFGFFTCGVTHSECDFKDLPSDCPLIPVPDHGRLIDADAAAKKGWTISRTYSASLNEMVYEAKTMTDEVLPTIVPVDKEGE